MCATRQKKWHRRSTGMAMRTHYRSIIIIHVSTHLCCTIIIVLPPINALILKEGDWDHCKIIIALLSPWLPWIIGGMGLARNLIIKKCACKNMIPKQSQSKKFEWACETHTQVPVSNLLVCPPIPPSHNHNGSYPKLSSQEGTPNLKLWKQGNNFVSKALWSQKFLHNTWYIIPNRV